MRQSKKQKPPKSPATATVEVTVTVADNHLEQFDTVVKQSEAAGLDVTHKLSTVGVVAGKIKTSQIAQLERVEGVAGVERARTIQLAPPDSSIQ